MPLPPSYKCPVCQKEKQRGHIGNHVVTHSIEELSPFIINSADVKGKGAHPEVLCSGHKYVLCINTKQGFEKSKPKHINHVCQISYSNLINKIVQPLPTDDLQEMSMQKLVDICKIKNIRGYSQKKRDVIIAMIKKHDEEQPEPKHDTCDCHLEITRLSEQLAAKEKELECFNVWRELIINSDPSKQHTVTEKKRVSLIKPIPVEEIAPINQAESENTIQEAAPIRLAKATKASKKEQEKGMWCLKCESCKCLAQYNRDLKPCASCKKLCHFNDDLRSCYHWECIVCSRNVCMECNKASGGNKLNSFCSKECSKKHTSH